MLLILEIALFIFGLYALAAGKIPKFLFGHEVQGNTVRMLGLVMVAPLPLAVLAGIVIGVISPDNLIIATIIEIIMVIGAALFVGLTVRRMAAEQSNTPPPM